MHIDVFVVGSGGARLHRAICAESKSTVLEGIACCKCVCCCFVYAWHAHIRRAVETSGMPPPLLLLLLLHSGNAVGTFPTHQISARRRRGSALAAA